MAVSRKILDENKMQCKFGVNMSISSKSRYKSGRLIMRSEERLFENYGLDTKQILERLLARFGRKKTGKFTERRKAGFKPRTSTESIGCRARADGRCIEPAKGKAVPFNPINSATALFLQFFSVFSHL